MREKNVLSCFAGALYDAAYGAVICDLMYEKCLIERSEKPREEIDPKIRFIEHVLKDLGGYRFVLDTGNLPDCNKTIYLAKQGHFLHYKLRRPDVGNDQYLYWEGDMDIRTWTCPERLTKKNLHTVLLPHYGLLVQTINQQHNAWYDPAIMSINWAVLPDIYDQIAKVSLREKKHVYQRQLLMKFVFQLSGQPGTITYQFVVPLVLLADLLRKNGFSLLNNHNMLHIKAGGQPYKNGRLSISYHCERSNDFIWKFIYALLALGLGLLAIVIIVNYPTLIGGMCALTCATWSIAAGIRSYRGFFQNKAEATAAWCNNMLNEMKDRSVDPEAALGSQEPLQLTDDNVSDYQRLPSI